MTVTALTSGSSVTVDTIAPVISQETKISTITNSTTPIYVFSSDKTGTITFDFNDTGLTVLSGNSAGDTNNNVEFDTVPEGGPYSGITIKVTDTAGNESNILTIPDFTVDITPPSFSNITPLSDAKINNSNVTYTLSKNIVSGFVKYTSAGDTDSPHTYTLGQNGNVTELQSGAPRTLSSPPTLVNGAIYTIYWQGTDAAGNIGNVESVNVTYDTTSPSMTISSSTSGVSNDSTTNDTTISLTFTSSIVTTNFALEDINVSGGTLSDFSGSGTTYSATLTPSGSGQRTQATTVDVAENKFTDEVGNNNIAATQFRWTYDNIPPTMEISSTTVSDGQTTNDPSIALKFTSDKATSNFAVTNISVLNGTLSGFNPTSSTVYTATFTPINDGATTINVDQDAFTDSLGNGNTASQEFVWIYDNVVPIMTITSSTVSTGSTTNDATIELTFTSSEETTNFIQDDITVSGGTLSNFNPISSTVYTATLTPFGSGTSVVQITTVDVANGAFTDLAGNNNSAATQFKWTYNNTGPTMTIKARSAVSNNLIVNGSTISTEFSPYLNLTFTSSRATTNFNVNDITVSGGELSNFSGFGFTFSARFTPTNFPENGVITIDVAANTFTDLIGRNNKAASQFILYYDNIKPTMTITSSTVSNGETTKDASISLTFISSKTTTNFVIGDISVTGGTLSNFTGSGTTYIAILTPTGSGSLVIQETKVNVAEGAFSDSLGNSNIAATQFNWTYDNSPPTMIIASSTPGITNGSASDDETINLTFTSSQVTTNFTINDITVFGGTLSNFSGSGKTYSATFTPIPIKTSFKLETTIDVNAGSFTNNDGIANTAAIQFKWTYSIGKPADGLFSGSPFNNAILSSVGASPAKDSTSNGSSEFARMRSSFVRTYTTAINPKKDIEGDKNSSEVTRIRGINSNSRTLNASNQDMRYTGGHDANVVRNARQRMRRNGGVSNKVGKGEPFHDYQFINNDMVLQ